jgi:NitT/TauT family transport system permease protein
MVRAVATVEQRAPSRLRSRQRSEFWLIPVQLGILACILLLWQVSVSSKNLMFFSRPTLVAARLYEIFAGGEIYPHILVTLQEVVIGYLIGAALGLGLGFLLGRNKILSKIFQPFIIGLYSVPKIALAPLFIVWFGLGMESKIAVVVLATFFLVFFNTFNTYSGLLNINEELVQLARLMNASWFQTIGRVILPASAGQIFIGLKTAVPYAVIGAVIGEYIGADAGLGHFVLYASQTFDAPSMFSGIVVLVALVFGVNLILELIEKRVMRWRNTTGATLQL